MSIADRFVTEYMPAWLNRNKKPEGVAPSKVRKSVRRTAFTPRPTVPFKPKPVNTDQYSTHL